MALDARLQFALQPPDFVSTFARGNDLATQVRNAPILDQLLQQRATQGQQTIQADDQTQAFVREKIKGDLAQGLLDRKGDDRREFFENSIEPLTRLGIPREELASIKFNDEAFLKGMVDRAASFDSFGDQSLAGRDFRQLISGMIPEKQEQAREVRAGVRARPVSSQIQMIAGVPHKFDRNTGLMEPVEVGGKTVTPETVAADTGVISEGTRTGTLRANLKLEPTVAATTKVATSAIDQSNKAIEDLAKIKASITNIDDAIAQIDAGAKTGAIQSRLPSIRAASIALDNIQGRMGLDIIGAVTFGALSESELAFALEVALPKGLDEPELRGWLVRKKKAQGKLATELEKAAIYLGTPGNTPAGYLEFLRNNPQPQGVLMVDAQGNKALVFPDGSIEEQ